MTMRDTEIAIRDRVKEKGERRKAIEQKGQMRNAQSWQGRESKIESGGRREKEGVCVPFVR